MNDKRHHAYRQHDHGNRPECKKDTCIRNGIRCIRDPLADLIERGLTDAQTAGREWQAIGKRGKRS
jgi:hypothetical protein